MSEALEGGDSYQNIVRLDRETTELLAALEVGDALRKCKRSCRGIVQVWEEVPLTYSCITGVEPVFENMIVSFKLAVQHSGVSQAYRKTYPSKCKTQHKV